MSNPIAAASRILGPDFLGPDSYRATFDWLPTDFPGLTLTTAQIEGIQVRNEQLVLMLDRFPDGKPMTMQEIYQRRPRQQDGKSPLLFDTSRYRQEPFYTTEIPKPSWRIVAKTPIGFDHDYQTQTEDLIGYLEALYPTNMPEVYQQAIAEYKTKAEAIAEAIWKEGDWAKNAEALANLRVNQLFRHSAPELLLHLVLHNVGTMTGGENLLYRHLSRTNSWSSGGGLVSVGRFDATGALVLRPGPGASLSDLGVLPSRSVGPT